MKQAILFSALLAMSANVLLFTGCGGGKSPAGNSATDSDSVITSNAPQPDSTIYGVAIESGMSTLNILTGKGDTLLMDRDDAEGYGEIYGYVEEGDSFAITKRHGKDGDVVVKAYNLTLLKRFAKDFSIRNGLLVSGGGDTLRITALDDDSLVVVNAHTEQRHTYYPHKTQ